MKCPECLSKNTRVLDSRPFKQNASVRRRRQCSNCSFKFITEEVVVTDLPMVVKKDGRREPFSVYKVKKGLEAACQKRPVSQTQITNIITNITDKISKKGSPEVHSDLIGRYMMAELKKLDEVAYVRFASVYMTFKEVNEFFESLGSELI